MTATMRSLATDGGTERSDNARPTVNIKNYTPYFEVNNHNKFVWVSFALPFSRSRLHNTTCLDKLVQEGKSLLVRKNGLEEPVLNTGCHEKPPPFPPPLTADPVSKAGATPGLMPSIHQLQIYYRIQGTSILHSRRFKTCFPGQNAHHQHIRTAVD